MSVSPWHFLIALLLFCKSLVASHIDLLQFSKEAAPSLSDEAWKWSGITARRVGERYLSIHTEGVTCSILLRIPTSDGRHIFRYLSRGDGLEFELLPTQLLLVCLNPAASEFDLNRAIECYAYGNQETAISILSNYDCAFFGNTASLGPQKY